MGRPTLSLRAAIGPGTSVVNPFIIGASVIGGFDVIVGREIVGQGSLVEIGDRLESVSTRRGRQRQLEQFNAGTLGAMLDNTDGALDPSWANGPYTDAGNALLDEGDVALLDEGGGPLFDESGGGSNVTRLKPLVQVALSANYLGTDYDIYTGFADYWKPIATYPEGGLCELAATDAFKILTRINAVEQLPAVGAGDTTGARVDRILDVGLWSTTQRDIDPGNSTHQETTLAGPIADQLRIAVDSERGQLYVGESGDVTFRERRGRYEDPRSFISQWTIGDGPTELNPSSFETINDDTLIRNDVNVARVGGPVISRRDPAVESTPYLWSSYNRNDLTLEDDLQVAIYAEQILRIFKDQGERVDSFTVEPDGYDELWPLVLGARFGDRVTINLRHPYTGNLFTGDYFIEGIDHDIPVLQTSGQWRTTFYLSDASSYTNSPFIIGTSLIGGTDVLV